MILDQFGQPANPAKKHAIMMMTPPRLDGVIGGSIGGDIDNSTADATIMLGTFNFPAYGTRHPGIIRLTVRENGADTNYYEETWAATIEPPWRVQVGTVVSGDLFTAGSSYLRSAGPNCVNLGNSSRYVQSAGVSGSFSGVYRVTFEVSSSTVENLCPGLTTVWTKDFSLNFTFTG
jgi:hypothetical protein